MAIYPEMAGKIVLITGASGDIGKAICERYLAASCCVYAVCYSNEQILQSVKDTHTHGHLLHIVKCNMLIKEDIIQVCHDLVEKLDKLDILINCAGICKDKIFSDMSDDDFDVVIKTNLYGTFYFCRNLLPLLRKAKNACIVNISSIAGVIASFGQTNYSASKSGIIGFSRTLAAEYATKGIRVNIVAPGLIESRMVKKVPRNLIRNVLSAIAIQRLGHVNEVANVVIFISSDDASYMVGQTVVVDGGLFMH